MPSASKILGDLVSSAGAISVTSGVANTAITGTITTAQIADSAITTAKVAASAILTADIADANVTDAKIVGVANTKITGNIISSQITSVANTQITGRMTASQLANTAVTAGVYGGSSNSAVITIDAQGRVTSASNVAVAGGVTSLNGQTGAVVDTTLYAIGSYIVGRPQNSTNYNADSTIAGSSLYNNYAGRNADIQTGCGQFWGTVWCGDRSAGIAQLTPTAVLINTGTWRCMTQAVGDGCIAGPGLWVRTA